MLRRTRSAALLLGALLIASNGRAQGVLVPRSWGTAPGYTTLMAHDLSATFTGDVHEYLGATYCPAYPDPIEPVYALGQLDLPDGAKLGQLQMWAYDTDTSDGLNVTFWETCQAPGFNVPASTQLATLDTFGANGTYFGFTPLNDHRVDAANCAYTVKVLFNPGSICKGDALQLQKVQVGWTRDVGPSPESASFLDVPANHPFFQYVEALAASGVTGGCGGGDYCPDAPLTRGQMAVFLAKALGLEWP